MAKLNMSGFATKQELQAFRDSDGAFSLGAIHPDHGASFPAGIADDRHLFIVAGSRAGKGTTMIIPNLITWPGGIFCIDPKGENAAITAMRRGTPDKAKGSGTSVGAKQMLGQRVAILDPFGTVRGPARRYRVSYDPLSDIAIGNPDEADRIFTLAEAIVLGEQGAGSHFTDTAEMVLAGLIEAVLHVQPPETRSLSFCRTVYQEGYDKMLAYLDLAPRTAAGIAKDAHAILADAGEEEGGSISTTLSRQLRWMTDPRMQAHLKDKGFSLVDAIRDNASIYVCIPPSRIPRMSRWMRLVVRVAFDAKMNSPVPHKGPQSLFLLDEFSALGHFQIIEDAAAYMAGYGIKLVPVIQNIGQVQKLYTKNWETFLGNAGGIIAWGLNDLETEKYVSDRLGQVREYETSYGESRNRDGLGGTGQAGASSSNIAVRDRAIRWPNEVHTQGARETLRAFIVPAAGAPFTVLRQPYMDQSGKGLFDSPDFIDTWEVRFAEHAKTAN